LNPATGPRSSRCTKGTVGVAIFGGPARDANGIYTAAPTSQHTGVVCVVIDEQAIVYGDVDTMVVHRP
jgi:hypothetical protein